MVSIYSASIFLYHNTLPHPLPTCSTDKTWNKANSVILHPTIIKYQMLSDNPCILWYKSVINFSTNHKSRDPLDSSVTHNSKWPNKTGAKWARAKFDMIAPAWFLPDFQHMGTYPCFKYWPCLIATLLS